MNASFFDVDVLLTAPRSTCRAHARTHARIHADIGKLCLLVAKILKEAAFNAWDPSKFEAVLKQVQYKRVCGSARFGSSTQLVLAILTESDAQPLRRHSMRRFKRSLCASGRLSDPRYVANALTRTGRHEGSLAVLAADRRGPAQEVELERQPAALCVAYRSQDQGQESHRGRSQRLGAYCHRRVHDRQRRSRRTYCSW